MKKFDTVFRGYDKQQVQTFLDDVINLWPSTSRYTPSFDMSSFINSRIVDLLFPNSIKALLTAAGHKSIYGKISDKMLYW